MKAILYKKKLVTKKLLEFSFVLFCDVIVFHYIPDLVLTNLSKSYDTISRNIYIMWYIFEN